MLTLLILYVLFVGSLDFILHLRTLYQLCLAVDFLLFFSSFFFYLYYFFFFSSVAPVLVCSITTTTTIIIIIIIIIALPMIGKVCRITLQRQVLQ